MINRLSTRTVIVLLGLFAGRLHAQPTTRVDVDANGNEVPGGALFPRASFDGRYVVFESSDRELVPGDTNGDEDIFVHDRLTGGVVRVSVDSNGAQANEDSMYPSISPDGRFVVFESRASNLVPGDTNNRIDIFLHDRDADGDGLFDEPGMILTERVSVDSSGAQANQASELPSVSANGRFVAFHFYGTNLVPGDTNGVPDVFVHDRETGATVRVSVSTLGEQSNGASYRPRLSQNGRYVAFQSEASNLVANDDNGMFDVFVHDRDADQDGMFDEADAIATWRVSVDSAGSQGNLESYNSSISYDGTVVSFVSRASNFVPGDDLGSDIFVHDWTTGVTERVSVASDGTPANNESFESELSGDGRLVAFWGIASNLVGDDTNNRPDCFVHDRVTHETARVSLHSRGTEGNDDSETPAISGNGRYVAFHSFASNLVDGDTNALTDAFVRDRIAVRIAGIPAHPNPVQFVVQNALGDTGLLAVVMVSCSGTSGFAIPGGLTMWLTLDTCTLLGLQLLPLLSSYVDSDGSATTPSFVFPPAPPGLTFYVGATTLDMTAGQFRSVTGPLAVVTQ